MFAVNCWQGVLQNKRLVQPTRSMFSLNDEAFEQIMRTHNRPNHVGLFAPPLSINRLQLLTLVHINLAVRDVIFFGCGARTRRFRGISRVQQSMDKLGVFLGRTNGEHDLFECLCPTFSQKW